MLTFANQRQPVSRVLMVMDALDSAQRSPLPTCPMRTPL